MAYSNPHKKMHKSKSSSSVTEAAKGVKTPYDKFVGQAKAYAITGKVVGDGKNVS